MAEEKLDLDALWQKFQSTMDDITKAVCCSLGGGTRRKIPEINTIEDAVRLINESSKILVLAGAGISVSAGIPDFRSENGLYQQLKNEFNLTNPKTMFDLTYFIQDGGHLFYSFFKHICSGFDELDIQYRPTKTHYFIKALEDNGKLLRNYTQNIDLLEMHSDIKNAVFCHGSYQTASCINCGYKISGQCIKAHIFNQSIPFCPYCCPKKSDLKIPKNELHEVQRRIIQRTKNFVEVKVPKILTENEEAFEFEAKCPSLKKYESMNLLEIKQTEDDEHKFITFALQSDDVDCLDECSTEIMKWLKSFKSFGVMKLDIVFFGESLSSKYGDLIEQDVQECDLLLVTGTSLRVQPVASIPCKIGEQVPAILINKELSGKPNIEFDVNLLGYSDDICQVLMDKLKWNGDALKNKEDQRGGYDFVEPNYYVFPNGVLEVED